MGALNKAQRVKQRMFLRVFSGRVDVSRRFPGTLWVILAVAAGLSQDFHLGPGTVKVYPRAAPNTTSFRAEPCT